MKNIIQELIKKYPNDADLGKEIKKLFLTKTKGKNIFLEVSQYSQNTIVMLELKNPEMPEKPKRVCDRIINNDYAGKILNCEKENYGYEKIISIRPWTS